MDWRWVIWYVRNYLPPHREVCYPDTELLPPETAGFTPSLGEGPGEHYRYPLPDGTGIHVRHHNNCYYVHWDKCDPITQGILCHLIHDAPHILLLLLMIGFIAARVIRQ